jgi:hypothetical protein
MIKAILKFRSLLLGKDIMSLLARLSEIEVNYSQRMLESSFISGRDINATLRYEANAPSKENAVNVFCE